MKLDTFFCFKACFHVDTFYTSCWSAFKEWFHIFSCWLFQRNIFFRTLRPFLAFNDNPIILTTQKMKFSIRDFFSKCDQIRRRLRIWSDLLKKSVLESLIFVQWLIMYFRGRNFRDFRDFCSFSRNFLPSKIVKRKIAKVFYSKNKNFP